MRVRFFCTAKERQFNWPRPGTLLPCAADSKQAAMTDDQIQDKEQQAFRRAFKDALVHLLRWLSPDEEQAGQHYEKLRRKLLELFARRGVPSSAIEELADETLDRVGRKLAAGEVVQHPEPMAYVHGVARNVLSEYWRRQSQRVNKEVLFEDLSPHDMATLESKRRHWEARQEKERWLECLDEFLETLAPEDEALLRACHQDDPRQQTGNRRAAAERLGLAENSLRVHLHRIRQALERKVRACVERRQK